MGNKRLNGEGMVRKRKNGLWEARVIIGSWADGKPIYKCVYDRKQKIFWKSSVKSQTSIKIQVLPKKAL